MVVSTTKDKRSGKFLDIIGFFNPSMNPVQFKYDENKFAEWRNKGALVTDAVTKLISGDLKFTKYNPKAEKEAKAQAKAQA